jgi:hypothetical protein
VFVGVRVCDWVCGGAGMLAGWSLSSSWSAVPVLLAGFGQADACRHQVRATARARISQFAEANSMCRWLRFLPILR